VSGRHAGPIDLLVTDVIMPRMTGANWLRGCGNRAANQGAVRFGLHRRRDWTRGVLDAGVAYLPKPFTPAQLSVKVREVLGQSKTVGRILVLDDDDAVRGLLHQALSDAGYEVQSAGDGREGMRLVAKYEFDLVLTDLIMPDREALKHPRAAARLSGHPDCAMSGAMDAVYLKTAELLGADVALRKPIECQDLLRILRELLT